MDRSKEFGADLYNLQNIRQNADVINYLCVQGWLYCSAALRHRQELAFMLCMLPQTYLGIPACWHHTWNLRHHWLEGLWVLLSDTHLGALAAMLLGLQV